MTPDWKTASDDEILNIDLIIALDMPDKPEDEQKAFLERVTNLVQRATVVRVLGNMDENKKAQFQALLEGDNTDAVNAFMAEHIPDFEEVMLEETIKLKRALLTGEMPS